MYTVMYGYTCLHFQVAEDAAFKVVPVEVEKNTVSVQLPHVIISRRKFLKILFVVDSYAIKCFMMNG